MNSLISLVCLASMHSFFEHSTKCYCRPKPSVKSLPYLMSKSHMIYLLIAFWLWFFTFGLFYFQRKLLKLNARMHRRTHSILQMWPATYNCGKNRSFFPNDKVIWMIFLCSSRPRFPTGNTILSQRVFYIYSLFLNCKPKPTLNFCVWHKMS